MAEKRGRIKNILIFSFLIFLAWMCRFPMFHVSVIPYIGALCGLLHPLIYMGICAAWAVSVSQKIINRPLQKYLELMAVCCFNGFKLQPHFYDFLYISLSFITYQRQILSCRHHKGNRGCPLFQRLLYHQIPDGNP